jgi:two-component system, cell cycle sensor histidine kinase and response regulator CckA
LNQNKPPVDKNRRILVIDDNAAIHDDFQKILCSSGSAHSELDVKEAILFEEASDKDHQVRFEVDSAYQGEGGVLMVKHAVEKGLPYAMAFVDVRMPPGWDGVKTTEKIWEIDPEIQIVICTAYSDYSWDDMFERIGNDDRMVVLKKPFDTIEALQLAQALTEKWRLSQQSKRKIEDLEQMVSDRTHGLLQANETLQIEIVDHKRTEKELRGKTAFLEANVNSSIDGILVVDNEGKKILQNQRMIDLWKIPNDIADEKDDANRLHWIVNMTKDPESFAKKVTYLYSRPNEVSRDEIELKDGTILDRYSSPVVGADGIYYGRIWSFRDITERKKIEAQLFQSQKLELIGQLAGGVAHDFNNILAAMLLNLELLQRPPQSPHVSQSAWREIEALAKRASTLTQQLLLFSRRQAMQLKRLEMNTALANLLSMIERLVGEKITCVWHPFSQELWVEADPAMLDQAAMNLCLNARDAMPAGGTLTLESSLAEFKADGARLHPNSRPGQFACLRISDTGCGMEADVLKHLFEPFFTTKEIGKGSGMGLASTYGIVDQHKGWVEVESIVGQGTSFRIYIPLAPEVGTVAAAAQKGLALKGQNETILLVEDEAALLFVTSRGLAILGYQVLTATNGPEALAIWERHSDAIDLMITDMRMPKGLSGLQLAEKLWEMKPSLKVIIMSGYSTEIVKDNTMSSRHYTFLAKPFAIKSLSEVVRGCLD